MYNVGDKIFYPRHGAGIIKAIEQIEIDGTEREYYVIHIPIRKMNVKIPAKRIEKLDIRPVVSKAKLKKLFHPERPVKTLKDVNTWSERLKFYTEKVNTGDTVATFDVVKNLLERSKEKPLNSSERDILNNARMLLISEVAMIEDISENEAEQLIKDFISLDQLA